jgi:hypothetical protein
VRIEVLAGHLLRKRRNIFDDGRIGGGIIVRSSERADGAGFHHERVYSGNDVRLQLDNFRCRLMPAKEPRSLAYKIAPNKLAVA